MKNIPQQHPHVKTVPTRNKARTPPSSSVDLAFAVVERLGRVVEAFADAETTRRTRTPHRLYSSGAFNARDLVEATQAAVALHRRLTRTARAVRQ